jgi:hypothetical protein
MRGLSEPMNPSSMEKKESTERPKRTLILRRLANEPLELVAVPIHPRFFSPRASACRIRAWTDGDSQVFRVELPEGYAVEPVDWRRFAFDQDKMRALLSACVRDNLAESVFEPLTYPTRQHAIAQLTLALADLRSILEVRRVSYELSPKGGERLVTIEGTDVHHAPYSCVVSVRDSTAPQDGPT